MIMDGDNYEVHAFIKVETFCPKCGNKMFQLFTVFGYRDTYICQKCETAYKMKLVKIPSKDIDKKALLKLIKEHNEAKA